MMVPALRSPVWGEGFVRDSFTDILGVRRWDCVSEDEFIVYFPKLADRTVDRSPRLVARLTECVAVRAFRLMQRGEKLSDAAIIVLRAGGGVGDDEKRAPGFSTGRAWRTAYSGFVEA